MQDKIGIIELLTGGFFAWVVMSIVFTIHGYGMAFIDSTPKFLLIFFILAFINFVLLCYDKYKKGKIKQTIRNIFSF